MIWFANGPELAPVMVVWVDFPVVMVITCFFDGLEETTALVTSAVIASVIYPLVLYKLFKLAVENWPRRKKKTAIV